MKYIHQYRNWPNFTRNESAVNMLLAENGKVNLTLITILKLSEVLNTTTSNLLNY
jgi:hypothetical protein